MGPRSWGHAKADSRPTGSLQPFAAGSRVSRPPDVLKLMQLMLLGCIVTAVSPASEAAQSGSFLPRCRNSHSKQHVAASLATHGLL